MQLRLKPKYSHHSQANEDEGDGEDKEIYNFIPRQKSRSSVLISASRNETLETK